MSRPLSIESSSCPPELRRKKWSPEDFEVEETVYASKASQVHKVKCCRTGRALALKLYWKGSLSPRNHEQVRREARIHADLNHRNILSLYAAFEDTMAYYLVLEWAEKGDVFTHQSGRRFPERPAVAHLVEPVLKALEYMHNKGILHRDIKPENLLIAKEDGNEVVKLADFGLCIDSLTERPTCRVGTVEYMAPEVAVRGPSKTEGSSPSNPPRRPYGVSADVWSVGVLIHELLTGSTPSDVASPPGAAQCPILGDLLVRPECVSEVAWDFIQSCLRPAAGDRPCVTQLLRHALITGDPLVAARKKTVPGMMAAGNLGSSYSSPPKPSKLYSPAVARRAVAETEESKNNSVSTSDKELSERFGRHSLSKFSGDEEELASLIVRRLHQQKQQQEACASQEDGEQLEQYSVTQRRGSWVSAKPSERAIEKEIRRRSWLVPRGAVVSNEAGDDAVAVLKPVKPRCLRQRNQASTGELPSSQPTTPYGLHDSKRERNSLPNVYDHAVEGGFIVAESAEMGLPCSPQRPNKLPPLTIPQSPISRTSSFQSSVSSLSSPNSPFKVPTESPTQVEDGKSESPFRPRQPLMLDSSRVRNSELPAMMR